MRKVSAACFEALVAKAGSPVFRVICCIFISFLGGYTVSTGARYHESISQQNQLSLSTYLCIKG